MSKDANQNSEEKSVVLPSGNVYTESNATELDTKVKNVMRDIHKKKLEKTSDLRQRIADEFSQDELREIAMQFILEKHAEVSAMAKQMANNPMAGLVALMEKMKG